LDSGPVKYEGTTLKEVREAVEKDFVQRALKRHNGNVTRAAAELDISRPTMYELMEKLGIPRE
jgi:two-component system NtrC family response regulator